MKLVVGAGSPTTGACWMSAVNWYVKGGKSVWTDHPECVDPLIASLCISLNDRTPNGEREALIGPHLFAPVGTAKDVALMEKRYLRLKEIIDARGSETADLESALIEALKANKAGSGAYAAVQRAYIIAQNSAIISVYISGVFYAQSAIDVAVRWIRTILKAGTPASRKEVLDIILELCKMGGNEVKACETKERTVECLEGKTPWKDGLKPTPGYPTPVTVDAIADVPLCQ